MQSAQNKLWIIYMTDFQAATESLHAMGGCGAGGGGGGDGTYLIYNSLWPTAIIDNRTSVILTGLRP